MRIINKNELIKLCFNLIFNNYKNAPIEQLKYSILNSSNNLNINEVTVILHGCSKLIPKDIDVITSLCSRTNILLSLNDNIKHIDLDHILTILWSLNRILKYNNSNLIEFNIIFIRLLKLFNIIIKDKINFDTIETISLTKVIKILTLIDRLYNNTILKSVVQEDINEVYLITLSLIDKYKNIIEGYDRSQLKSNDLTEGCLFSLVNIITLLERNGFNVKSYQNTLKLLNFNNINSGKLLINIFLFIHDETSNTIQKNQINEHLYTITEGYTATPPEVQSTSVPLGVVPSSNYLSLKSNATPGDRGEGEGRDGSSIMGMMEDGAKDMLDVTSSGKPESDLRELEGEVNRRGLHGEWKGEVDWTSGGGVPCNGNAIRMDFDHKDMTNSFTSDKNTTEDGIRFTLRLLGCIGKCDLTDVAMDSLLKLVNVLAHHGIQHLDTLENISKEIVNRSYNLPNISSIIGLLYSLSCLSYRNDSIIELCVRHANNNISEMTEQMCITLLDSCDVLKYRSTLLDPVEARVTRR